MIVNRKIGIALCVLGIFGITDGAYAAKAKSKSDTKVSVIQNSSKVNTRIEAKGLYDQECYDVYFGCMDQFCITDNESGGTCACSDDNANFQSQWDELVKIEDEAERIKDEEVARIKAGANADIVFTGERRYDEDGSILKAGELSKAEKKAQRREALSKLLSFDSDEDEDIWDSDVEDISKMTGTALYAAADNMCYDILPEECDNDYKLLRQLYGRRITGDCKAFENKLVDKRKSANQEMANANKELRNAQIEMLESANEYNLGECMVEFKKCMQGQDACGPDWENCVFTIASENMQNNQAKSTSKTKVATTTVYNITESTMEILESKRNICERVLDKCVAVRNDVWPAFLREAAPTISVAESKIESKFRQSCLTNISNCITTACRDDIVGKGKDTMDACLSRPEMVRSFCKVEIDPCERMEPLIWGYVTDKLAAMRVDACTAEVKDCFTDDTRCGADFSNCIGMDFEYIHNICPIDSLVVCKANNPKFSMDDLDSMLMGLYLNVDNSMLTNCQELVDKKMQEICGSTTDCNRFATDETIGTGSLQSQKVGSVYRVTGMISFGSIKVGSGIETITDAKSSDVNKGGKVALKAGELGINEYLSNVKTTSGNNGVPNKDAIVSSIEAELNNISGTIARTISMIEQDPQIQYCVDGRDLSQITGKSGDKTVGRFPNLLNSLKTQIAVAALRQAQDNYNAKFKELVADATKNASTDLAEYMCHKVAQQGSSDAISVASDAVTPPYAISYDVGSGLGTDALTMGGSGTHTTAGTTFRNGSYLGKNNELTTGGVTKDVTAVFNRETRTCHICTTMSGENCKQTGSVSWFHNNRKVECTAIVGEQKCEDVQM